LQSQLPVPDNSVGKRLAIFLPDFSSLWPSFRQPQRGVGWSTSGELVDGKMFNAGVPGAAVLSAHAAIPALNWRVFVDLPTAETSASFWGAVMWSFPLIAVFSPRIMGENFHTVARHDRKSLTDSSPSMGA
jgi:hypothetical protein